MPQGLQMPNLVCFQPFILFIYESKTTTQKSDLLFSFIKL